MSKSKVIKLVRKMLNLPSQMRKEEVETVLKFFGYKRGRVRGDHFIYVKGEYEITIRIRKGRMVEKIYIKHLRDLLDLEEWYESQK